MGVAAAALYVGSFALQTMMVFAGNSRLFGMMPVGSGWKTNVEMSILYTSLVTPANWAFAIWGIIYTAELVTVFVLAAVELGLSDSLIGGDPTTVLRLWISMNVCQGLWSVLFATGRLALSSLALSGIAASLVSLGFATTSGSSVIGYLAVCAPVWLHAGWTTAAALVNVSLTLVGRRESPPVQLAAAFATCYGALAAALAVLLSQPGMGALPFGAALAWALAAIHRKLTNPVAQETANNPAIAEVGEAARTALEITAAWCCNAILVSIFCLLTYYGADFRR